MVYSINNYPVYLLHFCGGMKYRLKEQMWTIANTKDVIIPDNLSIVSIMTDDIINESPLHVQLTRSNIPYFNSPLANEGKWENKYKARCIVEALSRVSTEYSIILDGKDVVFCDDATNIIEDYKQYGYDIIYNSSRVRFPGQKIETIGGIKKDKERKLVYGNSCFLNGGICIGPTAPLKDFYQEVQDISETPTSNCPYEQYYIRQLWDKYQDTKVSLDYDCKLFQVFTMGMTFFPKSLTRVILQR